MAADYTHPRSWSRTWQPSRVTGDPGCGPGPTTGNSIVGRLPGLQLKTYQGLLPASAGLRTRGRTAVAAISTGSSRCGRHRRSVGHRNRVHPCSAPAPITATVKVPTSVDAPATVEVPAILEVPAVIVAAPAPSATNEVPEHLGPTARAWP